MKPFENAPDAETLIGEFEPYGQLLTSIDDLLSALRQNEVPAHSHCQISVALYGQDYAELPPSIRNLLSSAELNELFIDFITEKNQQGIVVNRTAAKLAADNPVGDILFLEPSANPEMEISYGTVFHAKRNNATLDLGQTPASVLNKLLFNAVGENEVDAESLKTINMLGADHHHELYESLIRYGKQEFASSAYDFEGTQISVNDETFNNTSLSTDISITLADKRRLQISTQPRFEISFYDGPHEVVSPESALIFDTIKSIKRLEYRVHDDEIETTLDPVQLDRLEEF